MGMVNGLSVYLWSCWLLTRNNFIISCRQHTIENVQKHVVIFNSNVQVVNKRLILLKHHVHMNMKNDKQRDSLSALYTDKYNYMNIILHSIAANYNNRIHVVCTHIQLQ